ncbi:hypothetical protein EVG20_g5859 [Dentipellis fragilis]|uniref:N-acetyltransferase domain-containing protein n=1 Tax=Dentipellis fragilis TaxID=205917 RepID=A0A4Y9YSG3_9AGAM|nr:hypothetical protein EVG20_g5859 [Dentipellis fragilis]
MPRRYRRTGVTDDQHQDFSPGRAAQTASEEYYHGFYCPWRSPGDAGMSQRCQQSAVAIFVIDAQIEHAVALLVRAFEGVDRFNDFILDTSLESMTGGNPSFQAPLFRSMVRAGALEGSFYIAAPHDEPEDAFATIGIWFGPAAGMIFDIIYCGGSEAQRAEGWDDLFKAFPDETRKWWTDVFHPRHDQILDDLLGPEVLTRIRGSPTSSQQIRSTSGRATGLLWCAPSAKEYIHYLRPQNLSDLRVCGKATRGGKIVALATQSHSNTAWYRGLGFKVIGESEIPAPTGNWPDVFLTWGDGESEI